ncbi:hypothetical protein A9G41_09830 [Gilliamella sp. Nev5-1]|uniref:hypothetical protein n=1 Tax=Gilliamella sp. Nev5-1 TaxID=3120251 RepID=UPI00082899D1|nr:hypothetical protein [Gilliamella apicola]OCG67601.1 hypothetical protein A9G41_09830 [Gilliamella apicola]
MYNKNKFSSLDINYFFNSDQHNTIKDFAYADILGTADICGYQIMFFYIADNIEVLLIDEVIDNIFLLDKANQILNFLGFEFKLGSPFILTDTFNHNYILKDHLYEDHMRYYYKVDEQLIVLGINYEGILLSFELINNKSIIDDRLAFSC